MATTNFPDGLSDNGAVRSVSGTNARVAFALPAIGTNGNQNLAGNKVCIVSGFSVNGGSYNTWDVSGTTVNLRGGSSVAFKGPSGGTLVNGYVASGFVRSWNGIAGSFTWYTVASLPEWITVERIGTSVLVEYGASLTNGDSTITAYGLQYSTDAGETWAGTVSNTSGTHTFTGLIPGKTYRFRVYAINGAGSSAARVSGNILITTPPTVPTNFAASTSGLNANLSWSPPSNNGGAAISGYEVEYQRGSDAWVSEEIGVVTNKTFTNLLPGDYTFRVRAKNTPSGYGAWATVTARISAGGKVKIEGLYQSVERRIKIDGIYRLVETKVEIDGSYRLVE